jgi:adenosylhomocysteine nucleosidase
MAYLILVAPTVFEHRVLRRFVAGSETAGALETAMCGVGMECAAHFLRRLEERTELPRVLALVGVAGGLDPSLVAGDVVLASAALDEEGRQVPCTVLSLPGATVGPVITVRRALYTPSEKAAGRSTGALAVEMEAYPLAAWSARRGLSFIHARVILDSLDEALPDLGDVLDEYGRVRPGELLRHLLERPSRIASLVGLQRGMQAVAPALGRLAQGIVEAVGR